MGFAEHGKKWELILILDEHASCIGSAVLRPGLALGVMAFLIGIHLWTWVFMLPLS